MLILSAYAKTHYLLDAGADPNRIGMDMHLGTVTPLHAAVFHTIFRVESGEDPRCGKMILSELIRRGAHVSFLGFTRPHAVAYICPAKSSFRRTAFSRSWGESNTTR